MAIEKDTITALVEQFVSGTDMFLVSLTITPANVITIEMDADSSVDIDTCVELSRFIEDHLFFGKLVGTIQSPSPISEKYWQNGNRNYF